MYLLYYGEKVGITISMVIHTCLKTGVIFCLWLEIKVSWPWLERVKWTHTCILVCRLINLCAFVPILCTIWKLAFLLCPELGSRVVGAQYHKCWHQYWDHFNGASGYLAWYCVPQALIGCMGYVLEEICGGSFFIFGLKKGICTTGITKGSQSLVQMITTLLSQTTQDRFMVKTSNDNKLTYLMTIFVVVYDICHFNLD